MSNTVPSILTIRSQQLKNKRVLLRCDLNVPIKNGKITNQYRLQKSLDTINHLLSKGVTQIVIISHLGRPKSNDPAYSLKPVAKALAKQLGKPVGFCPSLEYDEFISQGFESHQVVLLENLRFESREKENKLSFAKNLACFGDIYVNDAFGTAHRKHCSNNAIVTLLPSYAGLLFEREVIYLSQTITPKRPFVCIIGFAKISDKLALIEKILRKADKVLVGGAVCFTFPKALGYEVGKSLVDLDNVGVAKALLEKYGKKIVLPVDVVCAKKIDSQSSVFAFDKIPKSQIGFDVGPQTVSLFKEHCSAAKLILWNGPLGLFEVKPYDAATNKLILHLASVSATTIIGGGDTASAVLKHKRANDITHISTGGGASLMFIQQGTLPAITILQKYYTKRINQR